VTGAKKRPGLVTVEGVDGAGKSTHIELLESILLETGRDVLVTREPGGTDFGEAIRDLLLGSGTREHSPEINPDAEVLAVFAARSQHLHEVIRPAIDAGKWVLCDRFTEASYAYQGAGRGVGFDRVAALEEWTQQKFRPLFTLLFLLDPDVAHRRVLGTGRELDRFESERADFFSRVSQGYERIAAQNPDRISIIDAAVSPDEVAASLQSVMRAWLER